MFFKFFCSFYLKFLDVEDAKRTFPSKYDGLFDIELYDEMDLNDERFAKVFFSYSWEVSKFGEA